MALNDTRRFLPEPELRVLIQQARHGDSGALNGVVGQVEALVFRLARPLTRRTGGPPIEDLIQVGLLAVLRSVMSFDVDAPTKFISYAGLSARREMQRAVQMWRPLRQVNEEESAYFAEVPDCRENSSAFDVSESTQGIRRLLDVHLNERDRGLVRRRFGLDGEAPQTYSEMAAAVGTSRQNVQQMVERALSRLRNILTAASWD